MNEEITKEKDIRLRCLGIAMTVNQMKHQHDVQSWMRSGTPATPQGPGTPPQGSPPSPPEIVDIFDTASEIYDYVGDVEVNAEENFVSSE